MYENIQLYLGGLWVTYPIIRSLQGNETFDETIYSVWYKEIINCQSDNSKIENQQQIIEQLKNYPLATKTPIEVFAWVASLQSKI